MGSALFHSVDNQRFFYFIVLTDLPGPLTFLKVPSFCPFNLDIVRSIWA